MSILTVDGGGSKFAYAVVDQGFIHHLGVFRSPASLDAMYEQIMDVAPGGLGKYDGMGLAIAGVIGDHTTAVRCPHLQWLDGVDLADWAGVRLSLIHI